jgi:D-alanyl-D-alanine carboxypeptidase (penicillin-binding protein 5/6)
MDMALRRFIVLALLAAGLTAGLLVAGPMRTAAALETAAREAILVDATTGTVLLAKNADQRMPPASMSKIMTAYLVFQRLKEGRLSLDDALPVSEKAWRKGGSKMFVEVGKKVRVEDLLRGVIVQSGNDACIVLAEGLSGSEEAFAKELTRLGQEIGLRNSSFANATGWPDPMQRMTARDLATLAIRTIEDFPEYYRYYSESEFTWNGIKQSNRNPLLYRNLGADGLKTGHTEEAGYGLTASAERDGMRLVLVVNGLQSVRQRAEEAERLIEWGFREFSAYKLFAAGEVVEQADVWLGQAKQVPLVVEHDVTTTLSRDARRGLKVTVVYDAPVPAPIAVGQRLATLRISAPDTETRNVPLVAGADVGKLGPAGRVFSAAKFFVFGRP